MGGDVFCVVVAFRNIFYFQMAFDCPQLKEFNASRTKVTDKGMEMLCSGCPHLRDVLIKCMLQLLFRRFNLP